MRRRAPTGLLDVAHIIAPAPWGGAERVVHDLAEGLAGDGGTRVGVIAVVEPGAPASVFEPLHAKGVKVARVELPVSSPLAERRAAAPVLDAWRPSVVHTHGYRPDVLYPGPARRLGAATVSTVHGFTGGGARMRIYETLQAWALRRLDAVVAVSRALGDELARRGVPRRRIVVIPNARRREPDPLPRAAARRALGLPAAPPLVAWIGRFSFEKGPDLLSGVAAALEPPACLVALGDGPAWRTVRAEAEGSDGRLRLLGAVPGAARYLAAFDALVLTSRTEGTPIVVLEAMEAGVPVVAPRVGGLPDLLDGGAGLLVASGGPEALAAGVGRVLGDPVLAAGMARAARRRVEAAYDPSAWVQRYRALYASLRGLRA